MDEIIKRVLDLPDGVYGLTVRDLEGDYNIYISSRMSYDRQLETYEHELEHIKRDDFHTSRAVGLIEILAHEGR